jgi:hypothetical protein
MADRSSRNPYGTDTFAAWVAVLDAFAANLDAIAAGGTTTSPSVGIEGLGPLPRSLEARATDLLSRTLLCERQVEEQMLSLVRREKLTDRMKASSRPTVSHLLDASS